MLECSLFQFVWWHGFAHVATGSPPAFDRLLLALQAMEVALEGFPNDSLTLFLYSVWGVPDMAISR
jgi:hypothetical protein